MKILPFQRAAATCVLSLAAFAGLPNALAATYTVTHTGESGAGSLRQAINDASATADADTIEFAEGVSGTISVNSPLVFGSAGGVTKVNGPGANVLTLADDDVSDPLQDPVLELYGPDGSLIVANDNWKDLQQTDIESSELKPEDDRESAIVATLMPNNYTAIVRGKANATNPQGTEGIALAEIYDLDRAADSKLANISTRGFVQTEENVVIGGFLLGGSNETTDVIIRALGPSLRDSGVAGFLADPTLELRDGNGALVRSNDNWAQDPEAAKITANGLEPDESVESAIAISLPPGDYTAIVAGKNNTFGVGLVEIYNLQ